jgi:hypothetical protein
MNYPIDYQFFRPLILQPLMFKKLPHLRKFAVRAANTVLHSLYFADLSITMSSEISEIFDRIHCMYTVQTQRPKFSSSLILQGKKDNTKRHSK